MSDVLDPTAVQPAVGGEAGAIPVVFEYLTGLGRSPFVAASLVGDWTAEGRGGNGTWSASPMVAVDGPDDGVFRAEVSFASDAVGTSFSWGVELLLGRRADPGRRIDRVGHPRRGRRPRADRPGPVLRAAQP
jgi:hypothetical protein